MDWFVVPNQLVDNFYNIMLSKIVECFCITSHGWSEFCVIGNWNCVIGGCNLVNDGY